MKTLIENLCGKLEDREINPITLAKAICIFLAIVIITIITVIYPILFIILLITIICILLIILIYITIE